MHDKVRGTTSMPEAGEGAHIAFYTDDLLGLQVYITERFKDSIENVEQVWYNILMFQSDVFDIAVLKKLYEYGLKDADGEPLEADHKALGKALSTTDQLDRLINGFTVSMYGRTLKEQSDYIERQRKKLEADGEGAKASPPTEAPEPGSTG